MTYWEILLFALEITKNLAPNIVANPKKILYYISEAEQELQDAGGFEVLERFLTLSSASADGGYALPGDVRTIDTLSWTDVEDSTTNIPVALMSPDLWKDRVTSATNVHMPFLPIGTSGGTLWAKIEFNQLWVYPINTAGKLRLRYKPYRTTYSPSNTEEWAGYLENPEPAMKLNGLPRQMQNAASGVVSYVAANLLKDEPNGVNRYGGQMQFELQKWAGARARVQRHSLENTHLHGAKPRPMGGVA